MQKTYCFKTPDRVGQEITLKGWVETRRDHGKLIFIDLRDSTGVVQAVVNSASPRKVFNRACRLGNEYVVEVKGKVQKRPENLVNPHLPTGTIEVAVSDLRIISPAKEPPFPLNTDGHEINEELRLRYRYLDLRRPRLAQNLRLRHHFVKYLRDFLTARGFIEIETPILTKTTPEGARDFLVPSRLNPGKFYALPQSPQQYKQLLMVAGFERYFQIARCFRDEDPRADRAYGEFTQLDLEMSFVEQADILSLVEELYTNLVAQMFPQKRVTRSPWPKISYHTSLEKYGSDKPDLRENKNDSDELAFAWVVDFPLFVKQSREDFFHGAGQAEFAPSHHMFTAPHPDDIDLLDKDPLQVRGLQHDLILNGLEIGGGSIRIHQPAVQEKVFDLIGFSNEQKEEFAHLLTAFSYGVPPHGGIAPGIERSLMAILGEPNTREVTAFPMTGRGQTAVMNAPSSASLDQLKELGIQIVPKQRV